MAIIVKLFAEKLSDPGCYYMKYLVLMASGDAVQLLWSELRKSLLLSACPQCLRVLTELVFNK